MIHLPTTVTGTSPSVEVTLNQFNIQENWKRNFNFSPLRKSSYQDSIHLIRAKPASFYCKKFVFLLLHQCALHYFIHEDASFSYNFAWNWRGWLKQSKTCKACPSYLTFLNHWIPHWLYRTTEVNSHRYFSCDNQSEICTPEDMGATATKVKGLFQLLSAPALFSKPTPSFSEIAHNFL